MCTILGLKGYILFKYEKIFLNDKLSSYLINIRAHKYVFFVELWMPVIVNNLYLLFLYLGTTL